MKDYYKILGLKKSASGEQIRGRYVELAKRYHPDLKESARGSEKIKEINEAYEVLKDEPTRIDYDLRMSLKRAYFKRRGKGREGYWLTKKAVFPLGILFVLLLIFLWKMPAVHVRSSSMTYHPMVNSVRNSGEAFTPAPLIPARQPEPEARVREVISNSSPPPARQEEPKNSQINSTATSAVSKEVVPSEPPKEIEQQLPSVPEKANPAPITHPSPLTSKPEPPINVSLSSPPLFVEEEVRQFLGRYIDRYIRKDIHGFLALFSPKAIQNGKDGLEKIREIYVRFFDQSEELTYRLDDIKVSINGSEAEAMVQYQVLQRLKNRGGEKLWKGHIRWVLVKEDGALKILSLDYQHMKSL